MKAEFTVFEEDGLFWHVPKAEENAAMATPDAFRKNPHKTKIAACRSALTEAVAMGATELHLYGFGSTTSIKREAKSHSIKVIVYYPSIATKLS